MAHGRSVLESQALVAVFKLTASSSFCQWYVEFQGYSVLSAMSRNILTCCDFNQVNGHIRTRGVTTLLASLLWFESGSWTGLAQCAFPTSGMKVSCILETLRDGKRRWWVHIKTGASLLKIDQWIYIIYTTEGLSCFFSLDEYCSSAKFCGLALDFLACDARLSQEIRAEVSKIGVLRSVVSYDLIHIFV